MRKFLAAVLVAVWVGLGAGAPWAGQEPFAPTLAVDPGIPDTVRFTLQCQQDNGIFTVDIFVFNDENLSGVNLKVLTDSVTFFPKLDSITFYATRLENPLVLDARSANVAVSNGIPPDSLVILLTVFGEGPLPPGMGPICRLWFSRGLEGKSFLFITQPPGAIIPSIRFTEPSINTFRPVSFNQEVRLLLAYGDLTGDSLVNVADAVYLLSAVVFLSEDFRGGDLNCDGVVDIVDIVMLIYCVVLQLPCL